MQKWVLGACYQLGFCLNVVGLSLFYCSIHFLTAGLLWPLLQNGKSAEENRFPYAVSLKTFFTQRHLCGGVLVSPNVVITAAHCVDPANPQAEIRPRVNIGGLKRHDPKAEVMDSIPLQF